MHDVKVFIYTPPSGAYVFGVVTNGFLWHDIDNLDVETVAYGTQSEALLIQVGSGGSVKIRETRCNANGNNDTVGIRMHGVGELGYTAQLDNVFTKARRLGGGIDGEVRGLWVSAATTSTEDTSVQITDSTFSSDDTGLHVNHISAPSTLTVSVIGSTIHGDTHSVWNYSGSEVIQIGGSKLSGGAATPAAGRHPSAYVTAFEDPACLKMILNWEQAA